MSDPDQAAKAHALANAYEDAGSPIMAGLLRVEAHNLTALTTGSRSTSRVSALTPRAIRACA